MHGMVGCVEYNGSVSFGERFAESTDLWFVADQREGATTLERQPNQEELRRDNRGHGGRSAVLASRAEESCGLPRQTSSGIPREAVSDP